MKRLLIACLLVAGTLAGPALAQEAAIRQALQKKFPEIPVEVVTKSPIAGLWEVYGGGQIFYVDEKVAYVIERGVMVDTDKRTNLTEERLNKLSFVKFNDLPFASSFRIVRGKGTRKMAYFADPNCGYCKKFEQDLQTLNDVTIHVFPIPILSPDSVQKAKTVWCSRDRAKAWQDWMLNGVAPTGAATCDTSAIDKLLVFSRQKSIGGTPTLFFANDYRAVGAMPLAQVEQQLAAAPAR
ncbi:MAG: DsbC family protein [Burkholderiales bacterium]